MKANQVVKELERRLLPRFRDFADQLRREMPHVQIEVWSSSTGSATDYQGHDMGVDCLLKDAPPDRPHNVALIVGVMHLTTSPKLNDAGVCWGHPSGTVEAELLEGWVPCSEAAVAQVEARLPELFSALGKALERGQPSDWDSV